MSTDVSSPCPMCGHVREHRPRLVLVTFEPYVRNEAVRFVTEEVSKILPDFGRWDRSVFPEGDYHPKELRERIYCAARDRRKTLVITRSDFVVSAVSRLVLLGEMDDDDRSRFFAESSDRGGMTAEMALRPAELLAFDVAPGDSACKFSMKKLDVDEYGVRVLHLDSEVELTSAAFQDLHYATE